MMHHHAVQAKGSDLRAHFKNTREAACALKHMELAKAKRYLEDVIDHKRAIPFRRFCGGVGRTAQVGASGHANGGTKPPQVFSQILLVLMVQSSSFGCRRRKMRTALMDRPGGRRSLSSSFSIC